jgi:chromosome segregation ATPase
MTTTHEGGALVALKDAAQSLGITRQALAQRIERRGISPVRRLLRGRALVYLSEAMLEELRAEPVEAVARQGEQARQGGELVEDLARLRRELEALRVANAKLEGELAAALKVEAATSRFADKLEAKLDEERQRRESLVRDLGRQEAVIGLLREQRAARRSWVARLLGRGDD